MLERLGVFRPTSLLVRTATKPQFPMKFSCSGQSYKHDRSANHRLILGGRSLRHLEFFLFSQNLRFHWDSPARFVAWRIFTRTQRVFKSQFGKGLEQFTSRNEVFFVGSGICISPYIWTRFCPLWQRFYSVDFPEFQNRPGDATEDFVKSRNSRLFQGSKKSLTTT